MKKLIQIGILTGLHILFGVSLVPAQGGKVLFENHCAVCHAYDRPLIGPPITFISDFRDFDWLADFTTNPVSYYRNQRDIYTTRTLDTYIPLYGLQPPVKLNRDELKLIWDFLVDLKKTTAPHAKTDSMRYTWSYGN